MKPRTDEISNPRITLDHYTRGLLARLAESAKMDWFIEETYDRKTITGEQMTALSAAYIRENFHRFTDRELFDIYDVYVSLNFDTSYMASELAAYLRNGK